MDLNNAGGGQTVFCNPPYGRAIKDWVKKSSEEAKETKYNGCNVDSGAYRYQLFSRLHL